MHSEDWGTATAVLRLASQLVDGIQDGLSRRGFTDVRPAHGFAFARISAGRTTTADLAEHLGVTKQAASQLVDRLVHRGYLTRQQDPLDARARLLVLTDRGRACTAAAQEVAAETVQHWQTRLEPEQLHALRSALLAVATPGPLRPTW